MIIGWSGLFSALAELENENGVHFLVSYSIIEGLCIYYIYLAM